MKLYKTIEPVELSIKKKKKNKSNANKALHTIINAAVMVRKDKLESILLVLGSHQPINTGLI
jgi:hypothetical protein